MPFVKNNNANPAGRPKGIVDKRWYWEKFSDHMMSKGLEKFQDNLNELEPKDYVNAVISMMEYFKPKLQRRVDQEGNDTQEVIVIKFANVDNNSPQLPAKTLSDTSIAVVGSGKEKDILDHP